MPPKPLWAPRKCLKLKLSGERGTTTLRFAAPRADTARLTSASIRRRNKITPAMFLGVTDLISAGTLQPRSSTAKETRLKTKCCFRLSHRGKHNNTSTQPNPPCSRCFTEQKTYSSREGSRAVHEKKKMRIVSSRVFFTKNPPYSHLKTQSC